MKRIAIVFLMSACLLSACAHVNSSQQKESLLQTQAQTKQINAQHNMYERWQPQGILALSLPEIATALKNGQISSEDLVRKYIERIQRIDFAGPTLQSVLMLNPDALSQAKNLDLKRNQGQVLGHLHGVPILLKDNIESKDAMPTTAGAFALKDNFTYRDSPLVKGLRDAGAIILGKTNLSQWANFRSNESLSGWSALGGQVKNPHILNRNPCGSSSGSGVSVAASLAAGAVGTETNGSIICPSTINGVVGFKPSVGLVSQKYIVPISHSGAAMMLSAMADRAQRKDYMSLLNKQQLQGARIGVLQFSVGDNLDINTRFSEALEVLKNAGAELVEIKEFQPDNANIWTHTFNLLKYEFKDGLNKYLADAAPAVKTRTLKALIQFNAEHPSEMVLFDQDIMQASQALGGLNDKDYLEAVASIDKTIKQNGIDALLKNNNVDVLVAPSGPVPGQIDPVLGDVWPDWSGAGYLPAVAGYPHASVPMGYIHGLPIGLSFYGDFKQDAEVLSFAYAYEQLTMHRQDPAFLPSSDLREEINQAMQKAKIEN